MNEPVNILVVEDEAVTAMDIQMRLQELGYIVPVIADSGEEAIKVTKVVNPKVILMDIVLKGEMDGTKAALEISKLYDIPIIFMTAYADKDTFNRAKQSAPYGYITKPFDMEDLRNTIELALYRHSIEKKLFASEQRFRSVMENATCGIIIMDQDGIISDLNAEAEKIFGSTAKETIGKNFKHFIPPKDREYTDLQIQKVLIEKVIGPKEGHIQQLSGTTLDIEFTAAYVDNIEEQFIFSIINDTTERNRLHARALLTDRLATVGTLTAGIIHEINNPMTYLLGSLNYIDEQLTELNSDDVLPKKQCILNLKSSIIESIQGAQKISEIIYNLKSFARSDEDKLTLIDIHKVIKTAMNIASPQFKNHVTVTTNFDTNIPLMLLNGNKLQQVFLNLIINSAQSMDNKDINKNKLQIKTSLKQNNICIDIIDTGKGMSKTLLEKIFEPFFTTKPIGIGTGLGLSISHEIIKELGGEIKIESVVGEGSTFSIYLPIKLKVGKNPQEILKITEITGKKILVIDDDPTILITLEHLLGKMNNLTKALGGRVALNLLSDDMKNFDIIFTDLNMPDINGADIFRYLTKNEPDLARHMIFTSAGAYTNDMATFLSSIKNIVVEKPFTKEQLLHAIEVTLKIHEKVHH